MRPNSGALVLVMALVLAIFSGQALPQTIAEPGWKERFRAHDTNGDGRIDREEFQQWMVDVFYHHDKSHKGYLVLADVQGAMRPEAFKAANRKGDGKLTLPEFLNTVFQDFEAADVNKNGALTIEEFERYIRRTGQ